MRVTKMVFALGGAAAAAAAIAAAPGLLPRKPARPHTLRGPGRAGRRLRRAPAPLHRLGNHLMVKQEGPARTRTLTGCRAPGPMTLR